MCTLYEDGQVVMNMAPQAEGANCFLAVHNNQCSHRWIASANHVCFLLDRKQGYLAGPIEDFLFSTPLVPNYPPVMMVGHIGGIEYLFWNTTQSTCALRVSHAAVERAAINLTMHTLTAWAAEDKIYVAGMGHRRRQESQGGFILNRGTARIGEIDVTAETSIIKEVATEVPSDQAEVLPGKYGLEKIGRPVIEAWLASFVLADDRMLIGSIADASPRESDWTILDAPNWSDFDLLGLYRQHDKIEGPLVLWHPYTFLQCVETPDATLVYLLDRSDRSNMFIEALSYVAFTDEDLNWAHRRPRPIEILGLDSRQAISRFSIAFDSSVGFYGIVGLLGKHASIRSIFVMSPDGIHWKAVQPL